MEMGVCMLAALITSGKCYHITYVRWPRCASAHWHTRAAKETFPDFSTAFSQMKQIVMLPDKPEVRLCTHKTRNATFDRERACVKVEVVKSRAVECLGQIVLATTRSKRLPLDMLRGMMTKFMKVMLLLCFTSVRLADGRASHLGTL